MCGKNTTLKHNINMLRGSPPRVREKPVTSLSKALGGRITPACAGKTYHRNGNSYVRWDHPRVCGKNTATRQSVGRTSGSPPRVREKRKETSRPIVIEGITPACAGKTIDCLRRFQPYKDHPRVCGKNLVILLKGPSNEGSPPRVREKRVDWTKVLNANGITPACAGKTSRSATTSLLAWDHPRVCGKNFLLAFSSR